MRATSYQARLARRIGTYLALGESGAGGGWQGAMEHLACFAPGMLALGSASYCPPTYLTNTHYTLLTTH